MEKQVPMISHMIFTDDLFLFTEATKSQMKCVMETIQTFCNISGQEVSSDKTNMLFSNNVSVNVKRKLTQICKLRATIQFGK